MTTILDLFSVGDRVSWVKVKRQGGTIDIRKHSGTIDEIQGTEAMIKHRFGGRRKRVSMYELHNDTRQTPTPAEEA